MTQALRIFSALADPTRLRIVALLRRMELSVGELAQVLDQSQPRVSRHVRILADAGVALRRREGSWVFLAPAPSPVAVPLYAVIDASGDAREAVVDLERLTAVRAERAAAAARYFEAHAAQWDAVRGLHVPDAAVEERLLTTLGANVGRLLDVGTGTGRMIELLHARAGAVTGIDRSPEMLRLARAKLGGVDGVELRQGDVAALPLPPAAADTVVMHQVLHYLPAPDAAVAEAARVVAPGGRLLIVDFDSHDREELRRQDAHARLGFSDAQIGGWMAAGGLRLARVEVLDGPELTVKLWLGTKARSPQTKAIAA